ncbi:MAG: COX15/CtaA family protein [Myxococcales bacterium]|nr:COX15/CtaA family protein [Myxococcales bacterium]
MSDASRPVSRFFPKLAWASLVYTILVVLFGAWVRITGSGAGCGQHWPTCHGEVVPRTPTMETVIEFSHRLSSGVYGIVILGLVIAAFRVFPRRHWARKGAVMALIFTISEALVGARLVLLGLVADNDSIDRAVWMAIHLINTSLLTGGVALTCWAGRRPATERHPQGRLSWLLGAALVGLLLVGVTGAVTALGDTLFPVDTTGAFLERIGADQSPTAHFLQRLRVMHPVLSVGIGLFILVVSQAVADRRPSASVRRWAKVTAASVLAQVTAGVVNILLSAPGWMQIIHLLLANVLWIALVFLTLEVIGQPAPKPE